MWKNNACAKQVVHVVVVLSNDEIHKTAISEDLCKCETAKSLLLLSID